MAHTTNIIKENDDMIVADLDNGGVRIGYKGTIWFDIPADHADYAAAKNGSLSEIETMLDDYCGQTKVALSTALQTVKCLM